MSDFKEGLYDQLVTRHVREFLDLQAAQGLKSSIEELEENDDPFSFLPLKHVILISSLVSRLPCLALSDISLSVTDRESNSSGETRRQTRPLPHLTLSTHSFLYTNRLTYIKKYWIKGKKVSLWVFWSSMMLCTGGSIACLLCKPVGTSFAAVSQ